jgi:protein-tyrosine phosphatase
MIDIHTHILPGIDDGAKDTGEAIALISLLKKQGISLAVLTPHYYPSNESISDFLERRWLSYQSIMNCGFDMILASETYLSESLLIYDSIDDLTIKNTRYLLLELPFTEKWGPSVFRQVSRIITKYNIRPIIAHVERYEPVKKEKEKVLQKLVDLSCLLQINIDSVVNRKTRATAIRLIRGGWVDFVGSDCHNLSNRPPQFDVFNKIIKNKFNADLIEDWNL